MNRIWLAVGGLGVLISACGGKAIIDEPIGSGGAGGGGGSDGTGANTSVAVTSTSSGSSVDTSSGSGSSGDSECVEACERIWECAFDEALCSKFEEQQEESFLQGCISNPLCGGSAALIQGLECREVIGTISSISQEFANSCN
jgi:hypothetical protein